MKLDDVSIHDFRNKIENTYLFVRPISNEWADEVFNPLSGYYLRKYNDKTYALAYVTRALEDDAHYPSGHMYYPVKLKCPKKSVVIPSPKIEILEAFPPSGLFNRLVGRKQEMTAVLCERIATKQWRMGVCNKNWRMSPYQDTMFKNASTLLNEARVMYRNRDEDIFTKLIAMPMLHIEQQNYTVVRDAWKRNYADLHTAIAWLEKGVNYVALNKFLAIGLSYVSEDWCIYAGITPAATVDREGKRIKILEGYIHQEICDYVNRQKLDVELVY